MNEAVGPRVVDAQVEQTTWGRQWAQGNQNVQLSGIAESTITVTIGGDLPRRLPLEPAVVPPYDDATSAAQLLHARSGVLPFVDRADMLAGLDEWMTRPMAFGCLLVGGLGGAGKTRLGVQLCVQARQRNWLCGILSRTTDQEQLEALAGTPTPRLVVVDYAESRGEQLEVVLPWLAEQASADWPVRVLLLVRSPPRRSDDWTEPLRGRSVQLNKVLNGVRTLVLDQSPLVGMDRAALFTSAVAALTARAAVATAGNRKSEPEPPPVLDGSTFSNPLLITIAAYLAVHEPEQAVPTTRGALLQELAEHEDRHWQAAARTHHVAIDDWELRHRIVALATLSGAADESEAMRLLTLLPDLADATAERRATLARWARNLYPGGRYWNPLEPDLLGEYLVAAHLADQAPVLTGVLQRDKPDALVQPLDLYARVVRDHPAMAEAVRPILTGELEQLCGVAIRQATAPDRELLLGGTTAAAALNRALALVGADPAALMAVQDKLLQSRGNVIIGPLALTVADQITTHYRGLATADRATHEPRLAWALNILSSRLSDAGRAPDALTAGEESVAIYRRLALANPARYEPRLAQSMADLSVDLANAGRSADALAVNEESVPILRRLAHANPARYEPDLAQSLSNLMVDLSDAGRATDALTAGKESVAIFRRLAHANPTRHEPDLARALNNLSTQLVEAGRSAEALAVNEESVAIRRRLATGDPISHEPDLAWSLGNLSVHLTIAGRLADALTAGEESVAIFRRLARANPARYEPDLAQSLYNLAADLFNADRAADALTASEESVAIYRRLARANPARYEPDLVQSLTVLMGRLAVAGRAADASAASKDILAIHKRLVASPIPDELRPPDGSPSGRDAKLVQRTGIPQCRPITTG